MFKQRPVLSFLIESFVDMINSVLKEAMYVLGAYAAALPSRSEAYRTRQTANDYSAPLAPSALEAVFFRQCRCRRTR